MVLLRIFGFIAAVALAVVAIRRFRARTLRIGDALIALALSAGIMLMSLAPAWVDPLLREMGFPPGDARRVIGTLVLSNLLTYFLLLRAFAKTDRLEKVLGDYSDRQAERWFAERGRGTEEGLPALGKLAVVIPALNEEDSLGKVLADIPDEVHGLPVEVLVVSDGSTDDTEKVAKAHGALVVPRDLRRGQGAAVALGYKTAVERGARIIATLDADGQYDPLELPQLIEPLLNGEADVVHGSRVLGEYESPLFGRSHGVKVFSWIISHATRTHVTDPASGFRAFTPQALRMLTFRENQFHASEVTVSVPKQGLRLKEVPCTFRERVAGTTKKPPLLRYGYGYARSLFRTWLG